MRETETHSLPAQENELPLRSVRGNSAGQLRLHGSRERFGPTTACLERECRVSDPTPATQPRLLVGATYRAPLQASGSVVVFWRSRSASELHVTRVHRT